MMMVNGNTWPFQVVEQRRYRLRFLNGCQSRFLILDFNEIPGVEAWMIGNEGGFLAAPVNLTATNNNRLLMGLAERADIIVDFTNVQPGNYILGNVGPDEPFGGGIPGTDFPVADPGATGQVMRFDVVPAVAPDPTTPPQCLPLPAIVSLPPATVTAPSPYLRRCLRSSPTLLQRRYWAPCRRSNIAPGVWTKRLWTEPVTENPAVGSTEIWEFYNATGDGHPMHVHEVVFEVLNRQPIFVNEATQEVQVVPGSLPIPPESWETGFKDTVIAYPGQVTRITRLSSTRRASSCGTATSSNTRTTR